MEYDPNKHLWAAGGKTRETKEQYAFNGKSIKSVCVFFFDLNEITTRRQKKTDGHVAILNKKSDHQRPGAH